MNIITPNARSINYGLIDNNIDVTSICYDKLKYGNNIVIPALDHVRAIYFSDPIPNVVKSIFITDENGEKTEYDFTYTIFIDANTNIVTTSQDAKLNVDYALLTIHQKLNINYGSMMEEYNEQRMVVRYLTGSEKVLELGGNIGRNSLVIASILKQQNNSDLVVLECDPSTAAQLVENRDMNNMQFHVERSALSKRNLIQKGWTTIESDVVLDGYQPVQTITYQDLMAKYNIVFDTLVLDCEGAFYIILQDMPEVLDNIKLIIVENDYLETAQKEYVDSVLINKGFYVDYVESGGWGPDTPFYTNFYEVWKRHIPTLDPVAEHIVETITKTFEEPVTETVVEHVTETVVEPVEESITETVEEPVTETVTETVVEPVEESITESVEEPVTETVTETIVEHVTETVTETVVEHVTETVTETVVEPVTETVEEPVTETVVEHVTETVTETVVEHVVEPVTETVVEPVTETVTETVEEPVTETITETGEEPVIENMLWERLLKQIQNSNEPVVEQDPNALPLPVTTTENESITYSIEPNNMTTETN
jgi:hypothetical protein